MEEYLIPVQYSGEGYGISVMFAGLNEELYDFLEISIDYKEFNKVERNKNNPYYSSIISFSDLDQNSLYKIQGKYSINNTEYLVESGIITQKNTSEEPMRFRGSNIIGAISRPPSKPIVKGG